MITWVVSSSVLIVLLFLVRLVFRKRISPRLQYALWLLVALRLLVPVSFGQSSASVMNYIPQQSEPVQGIEQTVTGAGFESRSSAGEREITQENQTNNSVVETSNSLSLAEAAKLVYIAGAAVTLACLAGSNLRFYLRLRRSRKAERKYKGLPVYSVPWLETPCMFGMLHPSIYLVKDLADDQRNYTLRHEYGHYKQCDHIWAAIRAACLVVHWYNPLVWAAALLSKRDGELSCDQLVTRSLDTGDRLNYGRTLVSLSCARHDNILCAATTMSLKGKTLKRRVEYIAAKPRMLGSSLVAVLLVMTMAVGCTFTGASGKAVDSQPETESQSEHIIYGSVLDRNGDKLELRNEYQTLEDSLDEYLGQGYDVTLTLDSRLQSAVNQAIENNVGEEGSGVAVIVDVNTGEPLAICGIGAANSRALTFTYQPNSLFMPLVATAALAENVVSPETGVECTGVFDKYADDGYNQECSETHGSMNVSAALEQDCRYFFCQMGNDLGIDSISDFGAAYGLGQSTGIELPEALGNLADRNQKVWRNSNTLAVAVGQEDNSFTALQYAEYCAAIANGGNRYSASLVKSIGGKDGDVYSRQAQQLSQVKQSNIQAVQQGMYERLNERYGSTWSDCALTAAGVNSGNMFMGYAPYDQPQIALFIYADYSRTDSNVQELAREIINAYGELYC